MGNHLWVLSSRGTFSVPRTTLVAVLGITEQNGGSRSDQGERRCSVRPGGTAEGGEKWSDFGCVFQRRIKKIPVQLWDVREREESKMTLLLECPFSFSLYGKQLLCVLPHSGEL